MNPDTESNDLAALSTVSGFDSRQYKTFRKRPRNAPDVLVPELVPQTAEDAAPPVHSDPPPTISAALHASEEGGEDPSSAAARPTSQTWSGLDAILQVTRRLRSAEINGEHGEKCSLVYVAGVCSGTGTTTIVNSLIRSVAQESAQVLLIDAGPANLLSISLGVAYAPGNDDEYPGATRSAQNGIRVKTINCDALDAVSASEKLAQVLAYHRGHYEFVVVDAGTTRLREGDATAHYSTTQILTMLPDTRCLAAWQRLEQETLNDAQFAGSTFLLLNQFHNSNPLHHEIKARLRVGSSCCVLAAPIRYDAQVGMALAHNTSIVDYAPESGATEDILALSRRLFAEQGIPAAAHGSFHRIPR